MDSNENSILKEKTRRKNRCLFIKSRKSIPLLAIFILIGFAVFNYNYNIYNPNLQFYLDETDVMEGHSVVDMEARFASRRDYLNKKCMERNLNNKNLLPNSGEFVINYKYQLVWCNIFKAASTSWIYNFNLLMGYSREELDTTTQAPLYILRQKYPRPSINKLYHALNGSLSFIIVRHPLERLVSAYRDKFLNARGSKFYVNMGLEMIDVYQSKDKTNTLKINSGNLPTFREFINYIICQWKAGRKLDEHWRPMIQSCTPCQVNFDIIIKFETLHEDQEYLIKLAKLEGIIEPVWINRAKSSGTKAVIKDYYAQISRNQIQELAKLYKYDLEVFQYDMDEYLSIGQNYDTPLVCKH